jgi:hypothetical protein
LYAFVFLVVSVDAVENVNFGFGKLGHPESAYAKIKSDAA